MENVSKTQKLVESGVMIALAAVLSEIVRIPMPLGGGMTIVSMLPVILISYRHGVKWGLFTAFVYSLVQGMIGMAKGTVTAFFLPEDQGGSGYVLGMALLIIALDYIIAYTALGLGGIFRKKIKSAPLGLCLGSIVAITVRFAAHFASGWIFYGTWAEWYFTEGNPNFIGDWALTNLSGQGLAAFYSFFYNGLYMIPEMIFTAAVALIVGNIPVIAGKKNYIAKRKTAE